MRLSQLQSKLRRGFAEALSKRAQNLYNDRLENPVKEAFYDADAIEDACAKNEFKGLSATEKAYEMASHFQEVFDKHATRLRDTRAKSQIGPISGIPLLVASGTPLELVSRNCFNETDYWVHTDQFCEDLRKLKNSSLRSSRFDHLVPHFPSQKEIVYTLHEFQKNIEINSMSAKSQAGVTATNSENENSAIQKNEVFACNLGADFDFLEFKKTAKSISQKINEFKVERDMVGVPARVRIIFDSDADATSFAQNANNLLFAGRKLDFYDSGNWSKSQSFGNRTVVIKRLPKNCNEAEILGTLSLTVHVDSIVFPTEITNTKVPYTSDVKNYIAAHPKNFENNVRIVAQEASPYGSSEFVIHDSIVGEDSEMMKFDDAEIDVESGQSMLKKLKETTRKEIEKSVTSSSVEIVSTLSENVHQKILAEQEKSKMESTNHELETFKKFDESNIDELMTKMSFCPQKFETKKGHFVQPEKQVEDNSYGLDGTHVGVCFVTLSSAWEAKKAIYALKFLTQFEDSEFDILGVTDFADHLEPVASEVYQLIHSNHQKRKELVQSMAQKINGPDPVDLRTTMESVHTHRMATETVVSNYDFDALRAKEDDLKNSIRAKAELRNDIKNYLDTFVQETEFSSKPYLESKLVDLGEVEQIRNKRGRDFGATTIDERVEILKRQLELSRDKHTQQQAEKGKKFSAGLNKLVKGKNRDSVSDSLAQIGSEYGLKNTEISSLKTLLQDQVRYRHELRTQVYDPEHLLTVPEVAPPQKRAIRKEIFEAAGKKRISFKSFSTTQKLTKQEEIQNAFARVYQRLEAKYTGDYFETDTFRDYALDHFYRVREK